MMNPCVSVIIPAYNAESTIERAVRSVVDQVGLLEIVIIDDCSTDDTVSCVRGLITDFPMIVLIEHRQNSGVSAARNSGIATAAGEYIAFLDADDVWLPGKLKKQLGEIVNRNEVALVTCDSLQLSSDGYVLKRAHVNRFPVSGMDAWKTLLAYNFIPTPTVLVRKTNILKAGGFSAELPVAEDLDLWIRISLCGEVVVLPEVLVHYYEYPGSLMKSEGDKTEHIVMTMLRKHIEENRARLTSDEIQNVLVTRNFDFGLQCFFSSDATRSIPYFVRSLRNKYRCLKSMQYVLRAPFRSFLHWFKQ